MSDRRMLLPVSLLAALILASAAGCGQAEGACPAPSASTMARSRPGDVIVIRVSNLFATCHDQGEGPNEVRDRVSLELVAMNTARPVLATGSAVVKDDGTAVVSFEIPEDAAGTLSIELDGLPIATVTLDD